MQSFTFSRKKNPKLSRKVYIFGGRKLKKTGLGRPSFVVGSVGPPSLVGGEGEDDKFDREGP